MFNLTSISVAGSTDIEGINNNNSTPSTYLQLVGAKFMEAVAVPVCGYVKEAVDLLVPLCFQFNQVVAVPVRNYFNELVDSLVPLGLQFNEAVDVLHRGIVVPVGHIFDYIGRVLFREEVDLMLPQSTLGFTVIALLAFTEIKSQGNPKFPFHPKDMIVSVNSVVFYGLASTVEVVILSAGFDRTSIFAIIARLGRIGCLNILVVSLAALFYV